MEIAKVFAAEQFFALRGGTPEPKDWTTEGLRVMCPYAEGYEAEVKIQHLAWGFNVKHRENPDSFLSGGGVYVDAHDGSILGSNEMV
jgi:hypothetical protein